MRACVDFWITKMREKQTDATSPNWTRREDDKCKGLGEQGCQKPTSTLKNSVNMKVIHACRKSVQAPTFQ